MFLGINAASPVATMVLNAGNVSISQESWTAVSFTNSWVDYGATWTTAAYFKDSLGVVHLKGLIKNGTINASAFTLPVGYRPAEPTMFSTASSGGGGADRIEIGATGVVNIVVTANGWVTLSGISFRAI